MAAGFGDRVLDLGLNVLDTEATHMHVCSAEPSSFANVATVTLGNKNFGAGAVCGSPAAGATPTGRKVTTAAVTDGTVTATGTATHWAITDTANSRLLAWGPLAGSVGLTNAHTFTLTAFDLKMAKG